MLTKRQTQLFQYLNTFHAEHKYMPSIREIMEALDFSSPSNVHRILLVLEAEGFIRREPKTWRGIEILRSP